jgi:hypothetical protein
MNFKSERRPLFLLERLNENTASHAYVGSTTVPIDNIKDRKRHLDKN